MRLLGSIFDKLVSVGVLALIILFQDEIRKFLVTLGSHKRLGSFFRFLTKTKQEKVEKADIMPIVMACMSMSKGKIGALIGPGGKNIKRLTETTGCQIDICEDNSGKVSVYARNAESLKLAVDEIRALDQEIEVGKVYQAIVKSIKDFGVFVECLPGKEGLVHVSELSDCKVKHPKDVCSVGDTMIVMCIDIDKGGKVRLSRRAAMSINSAS